ncbi:unnamed protein product [Clonostachys rosea]|uniref:Xylanolytic transcriptional activator regulatory domain-containing protein n=1 Tax=Bionectria ochroleuca TaxID=29856 RepID=A0ABY6U6F6_BIOOC|nr:unnamed protein product [Clonostachys rosea]
MTFAFASMEGSILMTKRTWITPIRPATSSLQHHSLNAEILPCRRRKHAIYVIKERSNAPSLPQMRHAIGAAITTCSVPLIERCPEAPKRDRATSGEIKALLRRIDQLEGALLANHDAQRSQPSPALTVPAVDNGPDLQPRSLLSSPATFNSTTSPGETTQRHTTPSGNVLGHHWYYRGMPILSERGRVWMASKTDQATALEEHHLFGSASGPFLPKPFGNVAMLNQLPNEDVTRQVLQHFLQSHSWLLFPVIDRILFEKTIALAYHGSQDQASSWASAAACILCLHSISGRLRDVRALETSVNGAQCADLAQTFLPCLTGEATMESLQAVLMLQEYRRACGQWQNANILHALACRMVCELKGHIQNSASSFEMGDSENERQIDHIRRLFWICYTRDKGYSLRSGQPPSLTGNYCDLTLPEDFSPYYDGLLRLEGGEGPQAHQEAFDPVIPGDVRLGIIGEEAFHLLYSPTALKVNDTELLLRIRRLDAELENWRLTITPGFRPRLSIPPDRPFLPNRTKANFLPSVFRLQLQLDYHYALTAIHTTVRRCGSGYAESENLPEDLHLVLHSSIDLLLEASRSTLILLKFAIDLLEEEAFCEVAFYSPVAVMSLFVDILIHPSSDHAQDDIAALTTAMSTIQNIPADKISPTEAEHIQEIADFIMETVRLGSRAIWKAKRNKPPRVE